MPDVSLRGGVLVAIAELFAAMGRIREGALDTQVGTSGGYEIGKLFGGFNDMARNAGDINSTTLAQRLATGATLAIRWTKVSANLPLKALIHAHFDAGLAYELLSNRTADHAEAVAAFRERRPARFRGR